MRHPRLPRLRPGLLPAFLATRRSRVVPLVLLALASCGMPSGTIRVDAFAPSAGAYGTFLTVSGEGLPKDGSIEICGVPLDEPSFEAGSAGARALTGRVPAIGRVGSCEVALVDADGTRTILRGSFDHVRASVPEATVLLRVLDAEGRPVAGASVVARPAPTEPAALRADAAAQVVAPLRSAAVEAAPVEPAPTAVSCGTSDGGGYVRCPIAEGTWDLHVETAEAVAVAPGVLVGPEGVDAGDAKLSLAAALLLVVRLEDAVPAWNAVATLGSYGVGRADTFGTIAFSGIAAGTHALTIEAEDHEPYRGEITFAAGKQEIAQVDLVHVQRAPIFSSATEAEAVVGASFEFEVRAFDPDGDAIAFDTAEPLPAWLQLAPGTGGTAHLRGVPPAEAVGDTLVTLRASDGHGRTEQAFTLRVVEGAVAEPAP